MTPPAKKTTAKAPTRKPVLKEKVTPPTITASDTGLMAIMRHLSKDHRLTQAEVKLKMGMHDSPDFERIWNEAGL